MWNKITKGFRWSSLLLFNSAQEHSIKLWIKLKSELNEILAVGGEFLAFFSFRIQLSVIKNIFKISLSRIMFWPSLTENHFGGIMFYTGGQVTHNINRISEIISKMEMRERKAIQALKFSWQWAVCHTNRGYYMIKQ